MAEPNTAGSRTPWQVTRSVWSAMFMRDLIARTMAGRMAWFWMIVEPIAFILIMVWIRTHIRGTDRMIINADFIPWMIVGFIAFQMIRDSMIRSIGAIDSSKALFAYRQVKPVDAVLVRFYVEGLLRSFIFMLFMIGGYALNVDLFPDHFWEALFLWFSVWMLGASIGTLLSVVGELVPEVARVVRMLSLPLMILSGVIFPLHNLPHAVLQYVMYNPIVHALEYLRYFFFDGYRMVDGSSLLYLWGFSLCTLLVGLIMQIRFEKRLKAK